jgi:hypothetical protein
MNDERRWTQDLELLSAYLDNALNHKEKKYLEARLEKETDLRERLENLRKIKIMVGQLSRLKAPRSFTLTPAMVTLRTPRKRPLFTFLKLASSLAAVLLVVLFGVELLLGGGAFSGVTMKEAPLMELSAADEEASPQPLIFWSEESAGTGGGMEDVVGMGGDSNMMEEPAMSEETNREEAEYEEQAFPPEEVEAMPEAEIESVPQEPPESLSMAETDGEPKTPILGINPEEGGEIIDQSEPTEPDRAVSPIWQSIIRWSQIALAVIAVGGALILLTVYLKRKRSI